MARSYRNSGARGGMSRNNRAGKLASEALKGTTRTYFFDIKEAKSGKPYLMMTETRFNRGSGQRERSSLYIYPEDIRDFHKLFQAMARDLSIFAKESDRAPRQQSFDNMRGKPSKSRAYEDYDEDEEDDEF